MQVDYKPFVDRLIQKYEGGYGWNKKDTGGPTKYGITCYDLAEHRGLRMTSMTAWAPIVEAMPLSEAEEIYQAKYADGVRFDDLRAGADVVMMDYGVNSGIARPIHVARSLCGLKPGGMDDALVAAINAMDVNRFINAVQAERLTFMHSIRGGSAWVEFGRGWGARVADLTVYADHIAVGATPPEAVDLSQVQTPKAQHAPATAGTATAGTAVAAATAAHLSGAPWYLVAAVCGAVVVAGVAYELISERSAATANKTVLLPAGA